MPNGLECLEEKLAEIEQTTMRIKPLYSLTIKHEENTANYARKIIAALGLEEAEAIVLGARFHDIGKTTWRQQLYIKNFNENEKKKYKDTHNLKGLGIIKKVASELEVEEQDAEQLKVVFDVVKYHHERYDGDTKCKYYAYPGERDDGGIPLAAKITTVADHFDAMTNKRPYRSRAFTKDEALAALILKKETEYDPQIVDVFVSLMS